MNIVNDRLKEILPWIPMSATFKISSKFLYIEGKKNTVMMYLSDEGHFNGCFPRTKSSYIDCNIFDENGFPGVEFPIGNDFKNITREEILKLIKE